jgi:uncharacterized membrane protein
MSEDVPVQVVVAAFQEEKGADGVLKELKAAKWAGLIGIQNAAVLRRDQKNKLHIKELKDWGGGKGAAFGGALGAVVGVLAGPGALAVGAAGALIGGLAAKLRDSGFSDARLKAVGESLQPGTSAIVAVIEHRWVAELEKEMEEAEADIMTMAIAADVAEQLDAGREVAYTALSASDAFAAGRVAAGEDQIEIGGIVLTEEGFVAGDMVATEEGIAAERLEATDEGVVYEAGAATEGAVAYVGAAATEDEAAVVGLLGLCAGLARPGPSARWSERDRPARLCRRRSWPSFRLGGAEVLARDAVGGGPLTQLASPGDHQLRINALWADRPLDADNNFGVDAAAIGPGGLLQPLIEVRRDVLDRDAGHGSPRMVSLWNHCGMARLVCQVRGSGIPPQTTTTRVLASAS